MFRKLLYLLIMSCPLAAQQSGELNFETSPSVIVIFGGTGDLTLRKVLPAIYNLAQEGNLSENTVVVGIGRREYTDLTFRAHIRDGIERFSRTKTTEALWSAFESKLFYRRLDFEADKEYEDLRNFLLELDLKFATQVNRIFYLATQPSSFTKIIEKLHEHQFIYKIGNPEGKWSKVVIEKPFGNDLASAMQLHDQITKYLDESQIYRIDHYLGKTGVQNLFTLRFENAFFEPIWNHQYIDNVQITVSEEIGIGSRARFWEETGLLRDIFQNHLLQLLSIIAMEPPHSFRSEDIHAEKIKLMRAIRPFPISQIDQYVIRGQYEAGQIKGTPVPGYREEKDVPETSTVETFVAAKMYIDNERWKGVPFYLRSGKRLPIQTTEIVVTLKNPAQTRQEPNALFIHIQPNPGVFLRMLSKTPGINTGTAPALLGYQLGSYFEKSSPEAYEKLLFDCIQGDNSAFVDAEEQFAAWRLLSPIIEHWKTASPDVLPNYTAGTWGPEEANLLLSDGRKWQQLE